MLIYRQDCQPVGCTLFSSQIDHSFGVIRELFQEQPGSSTATCVLSCLSADLAFLCFSNVWVELPRLLENQICDWMTHITGNWILRFTLTLRVVQAETTEVGGYDPSLVVI